ncbi:MAG: hydrolase [Caloramator sp.]|jgi:8-oxo-dGTP diphosphatase|uniref:NUDIX hydrolase n=1 Tax=Caloramator sp. TaxID=1871330 RepID=UPI001D9294F0|nr:NUDIX domain-containing protein [Caloramator sp.]MBZ4663605.1 hydrolase [Caloramator sp.]
MKVTFFKLGSIKDDSFNYVYIFATFNNKWVFVREKGKYTWEMPVGHKEKFETVDEAAKRELFEETGAIDYNIEPICDYSVTLNKKTTYSRLFYAEIKKIGSLPESEIEEVGFFIKTPDNLTYPEVHKILYEKVVEYLSKKARNI